MYIYGSECTLTLVRNAERIASKLRPPHRLYPPPLPTILNAGFRTGLDILQSQGREDLWSVRHTTFHEELSASGCFDDSDGSGSVRVGSLP